MKSASQARPDLIVNFYFRFQFNIFFFFFFVAVFAPVVERRKNFHLTFNDVLALHIFLLLLSFFAFVGFLA
jgi:hypothetical protein